jgi:hypothetical protein
VKHVLNFYFSSITTYLHEIELYGAVFQIKSMAAVDLLTHEGFGMSDEEDSASEWELQPDGQ